MRDAPLRGPRDAAARDRRRRGRAADRDRAAPRRGAHQDAGPRTREARLEHLQTRAVEHVDDLIVGPVVFLGNGINEDHWSATGNGAEMKLSQTLEPLEPLKQKINVIDGLFNKSATGLGIHPGQG